jgi:hypothetical protein
MNQILNQIQRFRQRYIIDPNGEKKKAYLQKVHDAEKLHGKDFNPALHLPSEPVDYIPKWKVVAIRLLEVALVCLVTVSAVVFIPSSSALETCAPFTQPLDHIKTSLPECYFGGPYLGQSAGASSSSSSSSSSSAPHLKYSGGNFVHFGAGMRVSNSKNTSLSKRAPASGGSSSGSSSIINPSLEIVPGGPVTCAKLKSCTESLLDKGVCYPSRAADQFQTVSFI